MSIYFYDLRTILLYLNRCISAQTFGKFIKLEYVSVKCMCPYPNIQGKQTKICYNAFEMF